MTISERTGTPSDFLAGGGEMGALIRVKDWGATPLGPIETWPAILRSSLGIGLNSRFPVCIYWGPEFRLLYNDAWSGIPGEKHPWALGRPAREAWSDIWDVIGPMFTGIFETGEAVHTEDGLLSMHRHGYTEETYFNYNVSPIYGDDGKVVGLFNAVIETTYRVLDQRRARLLRALSDRAASARSAPEALADVAEIFASDPHDAPFCLLYLLDAEKGERRAVLAGATGLAPGAPAAPLVIALEDAAAVWPFAEVARSGRGVLMEDVSELLGEAAACSPWPEPVRGGFVEPIPNAARPAEPVGFLVVGISPRRAFDDEYRAFVTAAAGHVSTSIANARAFEAERQVMQRLEQEVADRTRERDRIWSLSHDAFLIADMSGRWLSVSPAWETMLGWSNAELVGRTSEWMEHPDDRQKTRDEVGTLADGHPTIRFDNRFRHKDGSYRWFSWTAVPSDGRLYCVARDVTEERERQAALEEAQAALRQAHKMEAVGKLTGGVAHDFNNLLQVIGGNLQLLSKDLSGDTRAEQRLRNALQGVERGAKLASQLLAFGRRQPLQPKVVNLGRFVRRLDDMLRRALGEGIEIETVIAGGLWNTLVDLGQVENALLNLSINARDAMGGHGRLTVEAGNASLDDTYAARHPDVSAGQYVMLAVTDTGCGMSAEIIEQAFEPFFTTKPEGQGTGLGLSQVYGFVKQSHGHVKIYSEPGQGTTIRLYLPRSRQDEDMAAEIDLGPITGGTETILVVEDDENVRATVVELLTDLGYRVLKAKDAHSALIVVESGAAIDLLFTDVVMPGPLRSPDLARKARERLPDIGVLFTSGYTENAIVHGGRLDEGINLLSKPYTREALARKVRDVLRERRPAGAEAAMQAPPADASTNGRSDGALRVLLVEDDVLIRLSTADMLETMGHSVIEAGDAAQALASLEEHPVDVLVTDVGLPGMSGSELAVEARRRLPGLRVVFASGHETVPGAPDEALSEKAVLLRKPYDEKSLKEALRGMAP